ncbi:MAG: acyltransferase [Proteobacteria bacterium]|nr:acyltransferase [Pseudomonadota bacterium]
MPHAQVPEKGSIRYRPDIDGLRALAVVPVVLYHFGIRGFGGGFVGVDVFFVISGFLITALIHGEMRAGEFSVLRFYERRVRRIFPALFAMILAALAVGTVLLFPRDLLRLAESAAAATAFGSNFDFWQQAGYFDVAAGLKPLLHTWSLAVEEQFYLVFPALLYLLHSRSRRVLLGLVAALGVVSFAASLWAVAAHPSAAFYLAPYRTWELMLGAALALGEVPALKSRAANEAVGLGGLAAIAWAVFGFTADTRFPGANALFPCLGAAALIYAGQGEGYVVKRVLSSAPFVGVGLISYSLYLWHWPVHVFFDYAAGRGATLVETVLLIALSGALGFVSWRYVERPFRGTRIPRRTIFRLAGAAMAATLLLCGALFALHGLPQRFAPEIRKIFAEADDAEPRRSECFNRKPADVAAGRICTIGAAKAQPSFLLWGDSHADAMLPAVDAAAGRAGRSGYFVAHGRCPPILELSLTDEPTERCAKLNAEALALIKRKKLDTVILDARWAYYDQGRGFGPDGVEVRHLIDLVPSAASDPDQHAAFLRLLDRTVSTLVSMGVKVVLVAPVPEPGFDVPETLARDALHGVKTDRRLTIQQFLERNSFVLRDLRFMKQRYGVTVVRTGAAMCAGGRCELMRDGRPLYVDHHHLSVIGALALSDLFDPVFK